jgi:hypothetical protein
VFEIGVVGSTQAETIADWQSSARSDDLEGMLPNVILERQWSNTQQSRTRVLTRKSSENVTTMNREDFHPSGMTLNYSY